MTAVDYFMAEGGDRVNLRTRARIPRGPVITHGSQLQPAQTGIGALGLTENDLTVHNGQFTTSENEQTIEGLHIITSTNPAVQIDHDDVTLRGCKITHQGAANGVWQESSSANFLVEYCDIDGEEPTNYSTNTGNIGVRLHGNGAVARRNLIYGVRDAFHIANGPSGSQILENYVESLWAHTNAHNDSVMIQWAMSVPYDALIARNRFIAGNTGGVDLMITFPTEPTGNQLNNGLNGIEVRDNLIWGGYYHGTSRSGYAFYGGHLDQMDEGREANNTDLKFIGNLLTGQYQWGTNRNMNVAQTGNEFTGNYWLNDDPHGNELQPNSGSGSWYEGSDPL